MKMRFLTDEQKEQMKKQYLGKLIVIEYMSGEPTYTGRVGRVNLVDDAGQLHGTWGGCGILPGEDRFKVVE